MSLPLVSCIMPTANREKYVPYAIKYFLEQDYENKELIIIDDGKFGVANLVPANSNIYYRHTPPIESIGIKRNLACEKSNGEIIIHWDDDDWHASDWISMQVNYLLESGADMCGIQHVHYYSPIKNSFLTVHRSYFGQNNPNNWVHGATLAYRRSVWQSCPFGNLKAGEDDDFIYNSGAHLHIHNYIDGFVCILHPHNTIIREFEDPKYKIKNYEN